MKIMNTTYTDDPEGDAEVVKHCLNCRGTYVVELPVERDADNFFCSHACETDFNWRLEVAFLPCPVEVILSW